MKLRVRGKREDVALDVIWNEKQTPSKDIERCHQMMPEEVAYLVN